MPNTNRLADHYASDAWLRVMSRHSRRFIDAHPGQPTEAWLTSPDYAIASREADAAANAARQACRQRRTAAMGARLSARRTVAS
nr:hypothetical protein [uncultured Rhodopila sp.]